MTLCTVCESPCSNVHHRTHGVCSSIWQTAGGRAELVYISAIELLSSVASPEEYLHYICSESKRDSLWRDIKQRLLFSETLNVLGGSFCNEGAVVDYIPACKLYLFIHLWYFCVVSVLSAYRCYMEPLAFSTKTPQIYNIFSYLQRWVHRCNVYMDTCSDEPTKNNHKPCRFCKAFFSLFSSLFWLYGTFTVESSQHLHQSADGCLSKKLW